MRRRAIAGYIPVDSGLMIVAVLTLVAVALPLTSATQEASA